MSKKHETATQTPEASEKDQEKGFFAGKLEMGHSALESVRNNIRRTTLLMGGSAVALFGAATLANKVDTDPIQNDVSEAVLGAPAEAAAYTGTEDNANDDREGCYYDARQGYIDVSGETKFSRARVKGKSRTHTRAHFELSEIGNSTLCSDIGAFKSVDFTIQPMEVVGGYTKSYSGEESKTFDSSDISEVTRNLKLAKACTKSRKEIFVRDRIKTTVVTDQGETYTSVYTEPTKKADKIKC